MATSLTSNLNANYVAISNLLRPSTHPTIIEVYVESEADVAFWRYVLSPYEGEIINFRINLPSVSTLKKGKLAVLERSQALKNLMDNSGKYLILCVDSDYDYLLQNLYVNEEKRLMADKINTSKYIFQTYTYSIENYRCYAESLRNVCVAATLNDTSPIDFVSFFTLYANSIYDLLLWNLLFYSREEQKFFTIREFCELIKLPTLTKVFTYEEIIRSIQELQEKISLKIRDLTNQYPDYVILLADIASQYEILGLNKATAYLFVHGHTLLEDVALRLLKPIHITLREEHRAFIRNKAQTDTQKSNELSAYQNQLDNLRIETILSTNNDFMKCFLFEKIKKDIENYINSLNLQSQNI